MGLSWHRYIIRIGGAQDESPYYGDIEKLLHSNLWDVKEPNNNNSTPENIIPRFVTEALAYRAEVMEKNQRHHEFNPALNFIQPIEEYDTPTMRDKGELAKYLDMIS